MTPIIRRRLSRIAAFLLAAVAAPATAMWMMPTDAPVNRLVANMTAYTREHPTDPRGFYVLGRVHGLAFVMKTRVVAVFRDSSPVPDVASDDFQWGARSWAEKNPDQAPTQPELARHLGDSVRAFERAVQLDPSASHYYLGFAYVLEQGAVLADRVDVAPGVSAEPPAPTEVDRLEKLIADLSSDKESVRAAAKKSLHEHLAEAAPILLLYRDDKNPRVREPLHDLLSEHWRERAVAAYFAAYERAIQKDLRITEQPMRGLQTLIGYEAGQGYIRLVKARGVKDEDEKKRLARVEADIKTLDKKPENLAITPIIFPLDRPRPLASLLAADQPVHFDLDGTGRPQLWPWVRRDTGILVWDPEGRGQIVSGRQLFGSVTWWMFFGDGYQALDALDDNRDGVLSGPELRGLSVWIDRNGDGRCDPGEVIPAAGVGIAAISVRASGQEDGTPSCSRGVRMRDGRVLPSYDWTARPADESEALRGARAATPG